LESSWGRHKLRVAQQAEHRPDMPKVGGAEPLAETTHRAVVELADTPRSGRGGPRGPWAFDSPRRDQYAVVAKWQTHQVEGLTGGNPHVSSTLTYRTRAFGPYPRMTWPGHTSPRAASPLEAALHPVVAELGRRSWLKPSRPTKVFQFESGRRDQGPRERTSDETAETVLCLLRAAIAQQVRAADF
jgi:hypothetical protein